VDEPDLGKPDLTALHELAESKYRAWHWKRLRPKLGRRIRELKLQKLSGIGRACYSIRIYRELLERAVRKRIGFYPAIAHESRHSEMLAKLRLDEFQQLIMTSVGYAAATLKDHITMDNRAAGDVPESALPSQNHYRQLEA